MIKDILNIFFVVDKNYIIPFTVTLTSVLENNKDLKIKVFVIHEIKQDTNLDNSCEFFRTKYNLEINLIKIEDKWFENFYVSDHITKTAYFKFILAKILPEEIEHGLYLDCDIIVTGSLKKLKNPEFTSVNSTSGISLYAVLDPREEREIQRICSLGVKINHYFNSGVMLLNIKKMREEASLKKMITITEFFNNKLTYHDQDVLNILFANDYQILEGRYNMDAAIKYKNLPVVLHYMGSSKPWHYIDNSPYKNLYFKYLELTPYKRLNFETITLEKIARKYVRLFKKKFSNYKIDKV